MWRCVGRWVVSTLRNFIVPSKTVPPTRRHYDPSIRQEPLTKRQSLTSHKTWIPPAIMGLNVDSCELGGLLGGLTLSLLMSYIHGASCKARNFNVVYIWTYVWQRWTPSLSICCTVFQNWINAESFSVPQLCVNTLPATKITLITNGI
jgi:hypothetical protein